jgi:two-component system OmpR family response regulator
MKLLIVEDEARMAGLLHKGLTEEGHTATCAADGAEGLALAKSYEFDVIILDVMMPKLNGYELAKRLRADKIRTPILMLTARDSVPDVVKGLDLGADDYMTKPFSFDELVARLRAVKRRALVAQDTHLRVSDLVLDPASREVLRGEDRVSLTRTEYNLL